MEQGNSSKNPGTNRPEETKESRRAPRLSQALLAVALLLPILAEGKITKITKIYKHWGPHEEYLVVEEPAPTPSPSPVSSEDIYESTEPDLLREPNPEPGPTPSPEPIGYELRMREYRNLRSLHKVGSF